MYCGMLTADLFSFRLKKEEDDWNKLFKDLEEKAAQAERYQESVWILL